MEENNDCVACELGRTGTTSGCQIGVGPGLDFAPTLACLHRWPWLAATHDSDTRSVAVSFEPRLVSGLFRTP